MRDSDALHESGCTAAFGRSGSVVNSGFANTAVPVSTVIRSLREEPKENLVLCGSVEARLTEVSARLRSAWLSGPALLWGDIHPISECARNDLEKRIAMALREGFFNFSQLLCGFEVLLLQIHETGVVSEKTLLGIEKLFVHRDDHAIEHVCVPDRDGALTDVDGCLDGPSGAGNHCQVHKNPPVVDESCVRTADSTMRGDTEGWDG